MPIPSGTVAPPVGTIAYSAIGAAASHSDSITVPLAGAVGDLAVLVVVSGDAAVSVPTTPGGWVRATSAWAGTGFGPDVGIRRLTWFVKTLDGAETAPETAIPAGSPGSHIWGRVVALSRTGGQAWRWAVASAWDTMSGTGYSATSATALTWATDDFAVLAWAISTSAASLSGHTLTASGMTHGGVTERADEAVAAGYTARAAIATAGITGGSAAAAPTIGAVLSTAATGVAGVLRVRVTGAQITAVVQGTIAPRVLISVTGMLGVDIESATLYRVVDGVRTEIRAAVDVDVTGTDALLRVDAEQPYGKEITYLAELDDVNGVIWEIASAPLTVALPGTPHILTDAITGLAAPVVVEARTERKRSRSSATFHVGRRLVVVGKPRAARTETLMLHTETEAAQSALNELLDTATEGVFLLRQAGHLPNFDGHLAYIEDTEDPHWYSPWDTWSMAVAQADPWPMDLEAAGTTLQDIADEYPTLQDIADAQPTLLALAQADLGD